MESIKVMLSPQYKNLTFYDDDTSTLFSTEYRGIYEFSLSSNLRGIKRRIRVGHLNLVSAPKDFSVGEPDPGDAILTGNIDSIIQTVNEAENIKRRNQELEKENNELKTRENSCSKENFYLKEENTSLKKQIQEKDETIRQKDEEITNQKEQILHLNLSLSNLGNKLGLGGLLK
ncbi:hypothetical protein QO179_24035 [Bacillus stercoris]|nr:hypothetical protein [Bacillus stercoris]